MLCKIVFDAKWEYAGFRQRILAFLIDSFIINSVCVAFLVILYGWLNFNIFITVKSCTKMFEPVQWSIPVISGWLYYAVMESSPVQSTFGKMIFSIIVTDLNGNRVSFFQASLRYFLKYFSALIFGVGFIMIVITSQKQALHDLIAKCLVIKNN